MEFNLRSLKATDVADVLPLFSQLTANSVRFDIDSVMCDPCCYCLVAEHVDTGKVVGFGSLVTYTVPTKGWVGRLEDIVVDQAYRGKGLGKLLVMKLIEIGKDENVLLVNLESESHREAARSMYQKIGFVQREADVFRLTC